MHPYLKMRIKASKLWFALRLKYHAARGPYRLKLRNLKHHIIKKINNLIRLTIPMVYNAIIICVVIKLSGVL
jgi:hypothetical protein